MYEKHPGAKYAGALSMGVPGEIAGLHEAWLKHGRLAWRTLFQPAIKLAKQGFVVDPYLGHHIANSGGMILDDLECSWLTTSACTKWGVVETW